MRVGVVPIVLASTCYARIGDGSSEQVPKRAVALDLPEQEHDYIDQELRSIGLETQQLKQEEERLFWGGAGDIEWEETEV